MVVWCRSANPVIAPAHPPQCDAGFPLTVPAYAISRRHVLIGGSHGRGTYEYRADAGNEPDKQAISFSTPTLMAF
jgi:hypothetical protein